MLIPLWLATTSPSPAEAPSVDTVELTWAEYERLRDAEEPARRGPWAAEREIELTPAPGGWELRARWLIRTQHAGWLAGRLLGPEVELLSATLGRGPAPVVSLPVGSWLAAWIGDDAEAGVPLEVRGFIRAPSTERLELAAMPATRGRLRATAAGRGAVVRSDASGRCSTVLEGGALWCGAEQVSLEFRDPERAVVDHEAIAIAHAGIGLTIGDAELRGRAHLQWELRQGSVSRVRATLADLGRALGDLTVEGPNVARWSRQGDVLEVELGEPARGRVDLDLRWSQPLPADDEARVPLPRIEPEAWRSEASLQLARDGELEVVPTVEAWTAIRATTLPTWGRGLVDGTATASYRGRGGAGAGHLDLLRFVPVPGPPTVVDVASYTVATTDEGRVLMKAHYALRNDRGAHLTVRPPEGLRIVGARVAGETALPSRGDGRAWRLPLKRSLETVEGLLSFPVEVIFIGEHAPWGRRERRELPLPTLDAPIASARVSLHLPPRYRSRLESGEHDVVESFGRGEALTYGHGRDDLDAAVTDQLFQEAVEGYLGNDFDRAQAKLEQLEQLGVANENMSRLQANLDVIEGKAKAEDKGDLTVRRRVKEQAKARAAEDFRQQARLIEQAETAAQAGEYAQAQSQYQAALELGGKLAKLEHDESVEQQARNEILADELKTIADSRKRRARLASAPASRRAGRAIRGRKTSATFGEASGRNRAEAVGAGGGVGDGWGPLPDDAAPARATDGDESRSQEDAAPARATDGDAPSPPEDAAPLGAAGSLSATPGVAVVSSTDPSTPPTPPAPDPPPLEVSGEAAAYPDLIQAELRVSVMSRRRHRFRRDRRRVRFARPRVGARTTRVGRLTKSKASGPMSAGGRAAGLVSGRGPSAHETAETRPMPPHRVHAPEPTATPEPDVAREPEPPSADEPVPEAPLGAARDAPTGLARLPVPEVTATALSMVIPTVGALVRYEQLLIDAGQTFSITIDARRRVRR